MVTSQLEATAALEWSDLQVILAICRAESLSGAARTLGQTHSTVFRRINAIEEKTGVRFFDRFRHGYAMTDAGVTAREYAERVEAEFHALGREVLGQDTALRGRIRVTCPEVFAEVMAPGIMARFLAGHPDIQVDVSPGASAVDMSRREAEIAVRATRQPPETSFGKRLCDFRFAVYGTAAYMEKAGERALEDYEFCLIEGSMGWLIPSIWETKSQAERQTVFQCRASRAVVNAALEGIGLAALPCYVGDVDERLVRVTDTLAHLDMGLWVLTHPDLRNTARIRVMMAHLYDEIGREADLFAGKRNRPSRWNLRSK
ncbi:MAG: LysR family transcriptional regulator [Boseongicola sp.]|nr:LysR family transcriptional regulator [Boseongicola sp.]NNJ69197.1 LysR family transcriptional regulator [Boseongicola sp.]